VPIAASALSSAICPSPASSPPPPVRAGLLSRAESLPPHAARPPSFSVKRPGRRHERDRVEKASPTPAKGAAGVREHPRRAEGAGGEDVVVSHFSGQCVSLEGFPDPPGELEDLDTDALGRLTARSSARRDELAIAPEHPDRAQRAEGGKLENVKRRNASRGTVRSDTDRAVHAVVHSEASKRGVGARQQATVEEGLAKLERISLHACRHTYVSIMHDAALVSNASVTASATRART
jgi:hypothetical protein